MSITALIAIIALAVDLGMLFSARGEAQRAADSAALAGASAYLQHPEGPLEAVDPAKERALEYAANNEIQHTSIDTTFVSGTSLVATTREVVVEVIPNERRVRVEVRRAAVPLWFARIFGVTEWNVAAAATAEASEAGTATCMKPFAIPDENYQLPDDLGKVDTLKAADEDASGVDSFFFPFALPPDPSMEYETCPNMDNPHADPNEPGSEPSVGGGCGSDYTDSCWYRANICNNNCQEVEIGTEYDVAKGDMDGPSAQGINVLIAQDPDVWWDDAGKQLYRDATPIEFDETSRVVKVAMYDPSIYTHPSQTKISFTGIGLFFLEDGPWTTDYGREGMYDSSDQAPIVGRFLAYAPGSGDGESTSPFTLYLRLVE